MHLVIWSAGNNKKLINLIYLNFNESTLDLLCDIVVVIFKTITGNKKLMQRYCINPNLKS